MRGSGEKAIKSSPHRGKAKATLLRALLEAVTPFPFRLSQIVNQKVGLWEVPALGSLASITARKNDEINRGALPVPTD